jgi:catechol 2,3-dioxygenase-like lactoylglutathione lyase family enzyme
MPEKRQGVDPMKINSISGVSCYVEDLDRTTEFYEALGFRLGNRDAEQLTCYVNWFWVTFMAQDKETDPDRKKEALSSDKGAGVFLHMKVDDIDDFYNAVLAEGMQPTGEPQKMPSGGRGFELRDPDGYKLVFFAKK